MRVRKLTYHDVEQIKSVVRELRVKAAELAALDDTLSKMVQTIEQFLQTPARIAYGDRELVVEKVNGRFRLLVYKDGRGDFLLSMNRDARAEAMGMLPALLGSPWGRD